MNLIKDIWTDEDIKEFNQYLISFSRKEKIEWTKNILVTNYNVLAILSTDIKRIVKEIKKGNYESFIKHNTCDTHENLIINGYLITYIKDFDIMKTYLDKYTSIIDSWSHTDLLKFKIKGLEDKFINLVNEYIKSNNAFQRRCALIILFQFIKNDLYLDKIYKIIDSLTKEEDYYVNMANAWLLCELFIKREKETIKYLENNHLNDFTINKMISKCKDSYRISKENKNMLLKYKR